MKKLNVEELLQTARRQTGLSDFGPADFLEGIHVFIDALNEQGEVRDDRWNRLHAHMLRLLMNRLWFAKDLADHPEIADERIESPVIIVSLPRTGSTKLHRMLASTDDFQAVKLWHVHMPSRIPGLSDGGERERIAATRAYEKWMYETSPKIVTGHPIFTDEAEEDQLLGEFSFRGAYMSGAFNAPKYDQWLMQADMDPAYDYYANQLRYFQWQNGAAKHKPWLLKSPHHLGNEKYLVRTFKTPRIIVTHRDPAVSVASIANPVQYTRSLYTDVELSPAFGDGLVQLFGYMAREHMLWRDAHPAIPILDLSFKEINEDGPAVARKVYDFLGLSFTDRSLAAVRQWEDDNGREKHGKNVYSAGAIGKTDAGIREAFADYIARYSEWFQ